MAYELNTAVVGGRLTADPDVRYTAGDNPTCIARYTLAVNRQTEGADFIPCIVFGKSAEFAEKYLKKGTAVLVTGKIQTGSYTKKDGSRTYTTELVVDRQTTEKGGVLNLNVVLFEGRLTKDPTIRYTRGDNPVCIARYTLAVTRGYFSKDKDASDYISCICMGKSAEFVEKYLKKGTAIAVRGRIQTGSYTNKDGAKVYTTDVVVETQNFAARKKDENVKRDERKAESMPVQEEEQDEADGFVDLPEDEFDKLPFGPN